MTFAHTFAEVDVLHLRSPFQPSCVQHQRLLVVSEHVASLEALYDTVIVAAVPFADLAMHLRGISHDIMMVKLDQALGSKNECLLLLGNQYDAA